MCLVEARAALSAATRACSGCARRSARVGGVLGGATDPRRRRRRRRGGASWTAARWAASVGARGRRGGRSAVRPWISFLKRRGERGVKGAKGGVVSCGMSFRGMSFLWNVVSRPGCGFAGCGSAADSDACGHLARPGICGRRRRRPRRRRRRQRRHGRRVVGTPARRAEGLVEDATRRGPRGRLAEGGLLDPHAQRAAEHAQGDGLAVEAHQRRRARHASDSRGVLLDAAAIASNCAPLGRGRGRRTRRGWPRSPPGWRGRARAGRRRRGARQASGSAARSLRLRSTAAGRRAPRCRCSPCACAWPTISQRRRARRRPCGSSRGSAGRAPRCRAGTGASVGVAADDHAVEALGRQKATSAPTNSCP